MEYKKEELLDKINDFGFPDVNVVLSLDEFFSGNENYGSIGVNIPNQPAPTTFYETFKNLKKSYSVDSILVKITDTDDPEEWFFSDLIYVIGDLTLEELESNVSNLSFDEIYEGWGSDKPVNVEDYDESKNVYRIWWD